VLVLLVERRSVLDGVHLAVDADALEALLLPVGQFLAELALAADHGGASSSRRVPSGSTMILSAIWVTVWLSIGRPVTGE
jgi:hypothetical protein